MTEKKYEVLRNCQWGSLYLEKGQRVIITPQDQKSSLVQLYGSNKTVNVNSETVLGKISVGQIREV